MNATWQALIGNLSAVIVFISAWAHFQHRLEGRPQRVRRPLFAIWMGAGAIVSMLLSAQLQPGIFFDLRATLVVISGFLGGPIGGVVAGAIAGTYRLAVGGTGGLSGTILVGTASVLGICAHYLVKYDAPRPPAMIAAGLASGVAGISGMLFMPPYVQAAAFVTFAAPVFLLNFAATYVALYSLVRAGHLRSEQHVMRMALNEAPDYFYIKDLESRFVAVNAGVARHNGFVRPKDMIGKSDYDLRPTDRARKLFVAEQEVMRANLPVIDREETIKDEAGNDQYFVTSKLPLKDSENRVVGLVGVTRDVTRYRQLEAELRESHMLFSRALSDMSDGVAMFDRNGVLVFCNERYRTSFPLTSNVRVAGTSLRSILAEVIRTGEQLDIPQSNSEAWVDQVIASLGTGGEEQVPLFDGRWLHIRTRPGTEGSSLVVVSDATTIKSAETALRGLTEQLRTLATTDGLTGLANRRALDQVLPVEVARTVRQSQKLALLMIDVDKFKAFNDIYGHPAGDQCLREIGQCLAKVTRRPGDLAVRYGGEEFVLLLPDTDEDGAYFVAETFRNSLKSKAMPHKGSEKGIVTASVGIATTADGLIDHADLLVRADQALYSAKSAGRDRVMGWHRGTDSGSDIESNWRAVIDY